MERREHQLFVARQGRRQDLVDRSIIVRYLLANIEECINYGVAHSDNPIRRNALAQEIVAGSGGRCEMKSRGESYDPTIELLRPRRIEIASAETGLDMSNGTRFMKAAVAAADAVAVSP
jgi:hypothetical protein